MISPFVFENSLVAVEKNIGAGAQTQLKRS
jgi:hypothetical protein